MAGPMMPRQPSGAAGRGPGSMMSKSKMKPMPGAGPMAGEMPTPIGTPPQSHMSPGGDAKNPTMALVSNGASKAKPARTVPGLGVGRPVGGPPGQSKSKPGRRLAVGSPFGGTGGPRPGALGPNQTRVSKRAVTGKPGASKAKTLQSPKAAGNPFTRNATRRS